MYFHFCVKFLLTDLNTCLTIWSCSLGYAVIILLMGGAIVSMHFLILFLETSLPDFRENEQTIKDVHGYLTEAVESSKKCRKFSVMALFALNWIFTLWSFRGQILQHLVFRQQSFMYSLLPPFGILSGAIIFLIPIHFHHLILFPKIETSTIIW